MPKRSATDKIEYYSAKIKKLQHKSEKNQKRQRHRVIVYSSSDSEDNSVIRLEDAPPSALHPPPSPAAASPFLPSLPLAPEENITPTQDGNDVISVPELNPELLQALGDAADDVPVFGPDIHKKLAQLWLPILKKGLQTDSKEKLLKDITIPDNCKLLRAPLLNPEIAAAVSDTARVRDKKIQIKQDQLGLGITAINRAMSLLLTGDDKVQAIKILSDGCRILSDLHFIETQVRTKLITPGLDKSFLNVIQDHERDETLFGNTLPEKIKACKAIERQGLQIKKAHIQKPSTSHATSTTARPRHQGNWSGPSRFNSSNRGGRTASYKNQYRRAPPLPAPSATRPSTSTFTPSHKRAPTRQ